MDNFTGQERLLNGPQNPQTHEQTASLAKYKDSISMELGR